MLDADLPGMKQTGTISGLVRVPHANRAIRIGDSPVLLDLVRAPRAEHAVLAMRRDFYAEARLSL
jgi:hypothetical protein